MKDEPNAELLLSLRGLDKSEEKHQEFVNERQQLINAVRALNDAREREEKRLAGLKAAAQRRKKNGK